MNGAGEGVKEGAWRGHVFGVPLDGDDPRWSGQFHALYDIVLRGAGSDGEAGAGAVDGLVVAGVDAGGGPADGGEAGGGLDDDVVLDVGVGIADVLVEGAAEDDVEKLHAAADGEQRHAGSEGGAGEFDFEGVAFGVGVAGGEIGLAVESGGDVGAAGEDEAAERVEGWCGVGGDAGDVEAGGLEGVAIGAGLGWEAVGEADAGGHIHIVRETGETGGAIPAAAHGGKAAGGGRGMDGEEKGW